MAKSRFYSSRLNKTTMVEVFKTNVDEWRDATMIIDQIHRTIADHVANFDLEDCDKILRIQCHKGFVQSERIMRLLKMFGFEAGILPDVKPTMVQILLFDKKFYPVFD